MQSKISLQPTQHVRPVGLLGRQTSHRRLLQDDETFATPLVLILLDCFGAEALEWTPQTIKDELEDTYAIKLPDINLDKIMAAVMILTTNYFYRDVRSFIHICNVMSGNDVDPTEFNPADPFEMLLAINEAFMLWPPGSQDAVDEQFSEEIQEYIRQVFDVEGILKPIDVFHVAMRSDRTSQIAETYSDDPDMFAAVYKTQQEKVGELGSAYLEAMRELTGQLEGLPLQNGTTDELVARLHKGLKLFADLYMKDESL